MSARAYYTYVLHVISCQVLVVTSARFFFHPVTRLSVWVYFLHDFFLPPPRLAVVMSSLFLFVCLPICLQDDSKSCGRILSFFCSDGM